MHQTFREQTWDETGFALFYQQYAAPILDYLRTQTRTLEDAEDLLVDVFLAARQAPQIGHETARGQFAWLRQVARNKLVDSYRRGGQAKAIPLEKAWSLADPETAHNPEQALVQTETLEQLRAIVQRLPAPQRELLQLRFAEGLRCPQIATRMGKREGAVRTMLVRTLKMLRGMYHANREEHR
jgi:RNA polymerase sigma factor (sigma-70 family)